MYSIYVCLCVGVQTLYSLNLIPIFCFIVFQMIKLHFFLKKNLKLSFYFKSLRLKYYLTEFMWAKEYFPLLTWEKNQIKMILHDRIVIPVDCIYKDKIIRAS